jgi:hypothetical protein
VKLGAGTAVLCPYKGEEGGASDGAALVWAGSDSGSSLAKVNEHKEARTLERWVDMEVSRKKI